MDCRWRCRGAAAAIGRLVTAGVVAALLLSGCGGGSGEPSATAGGRPDNLVRVTSVKYPSSGGTEVAGLAAIPRSVPSRGCVIWQFGFRSTKQDASYAWQGLAGLGLTTFSIDFRNHGDRAESKDEYQQVLNDPEKFDAMVRGSVEDLRSAVDYLEKQPYCAENIAYAGVSLGGAIGTMFAAEDKRVKALVLVVTPGTWTTLIDVPNSPILEGVSKRPATKAAALKIFSQLDPDRYIAKVAPRPVMIARGLTDKTVLPSNAGALQKAARKPKQILDFRGGHNPAIGPDAEKLANDIGSFLLHNMVQPTYGIKSRPNGTFFVQ